MLGCRMVAFSEELRASLARIDDLKQQLDALRPTLTPAVLDRVFQKFRLDWNYHSNSIEGNSLTFGETVAFLMEGVTAKGKPLKDHLDLRGHNAAIDFLLALVKDDRGITEADIRELHKLILVEPYPVRAQTPDGRPTTKIIQLGQYKTTPNSVETPTGETHHYASPEETPAKMQELVAWYRENRDALPPLVLAALFHHRFVAIHPFDDGNGRMTRLLTNLLLMQAGFPPIVIKTEEKSEYYGVLSQADAGVTEPLLEFFAEHLLRSLELYLRGANGEDIAERSDVYKKIALLKAEVDKSRQVVKLPLTLKSSISFMTDSWAPLADELVEQAKHLDDLFLTSKWSFTIKGPIGIDGEYFGDEKAPPSEHWSIIKEHFVAQEELLGNVHFTYHWGGYQGGAIEAAPFDVRVRIETHLGQYQYTILILNTKFSFSKLYEPPMTADERAKIVEGFLQAALDDISRISPPASTK